MSDLHRPEDENKDAEQGASIKATPRTDAQKDELNERIDNAMMRYGYVQSEFEKASDLELSQDWGGRESSGREAEMVTKDSIDPRLKPPKNIGPAIDGAAFDQRWQDEQNNAQESNKDDDPSRDDDPER